DALAGVLCLVLFCSTSLLAGVTDDPAIANEIRSVSMRLRVQQSNLSETELEKLAETLGRSNYLVRTIPMVIWRNDFTNAQLMLKQFPGKLDDLKGFAPPLLERAVQMGNEAQVEFLLAQGANPDHTQQGWSPPVRTAVQSRHWSIAKQLLTAGASATQTNLWGQSPLDLAVGTLWNATSTNDPSIEVIRLLLQAGGDPFTDS